MTRSIRKLPVDVVALARAYTPANILKLAGYATGANIDPDIQIRAIGMLLDRAHGKAPQQHEAKVDGTIEIVLRDIAAEAIKRRQQKP